MLYSFRYFIFLLEEKAEWVVEKLNVISVQMLCAIEQVR